MANLLLHPTESIAAQFTPVTEQTVLVQRFTYRKNDIEWRKIIETHLMPRPMAAYEWKKAMATHGYRPYITFDN
jgi:hypothetical protein